MDGDPGDTSLFNLKPDQKTYEEKINAISLNDFFEEEKLDVCNFLKLDCEGAEYSILMNASDSTLNKIQRIAMEWHRFSAEQDPKSLVDFLKNKGFKIKEISPLNKITGFLFAYR